MGNTSTPPKDRSMSGPRHRSLISEDLTWKIPRDFRVKTGTLGLKTEQETSRRELCRPRSRLLRELSKERPCPRYRG